MKDLCDYYDKPELSNGVLLMYFNSLINFDLDQVSQAITKHIETPERGRFFPKIADFKRILEGGEITPDMVLAAANGKRTPFGILARIFIGSWDIAHMGSYDLRRRAIECQDMIPEWCERAARGEYTEHELRTMIANNVNPLAPFTNGISGPVCSEALTLRIESIKSNRAERLMLESQEAGKIKDEPVNLEQQRLIFKKIRDALDQPMEPIDEN